MSNDLLAGFMDDATARGVVRSWEIPTPVARESPFGFVLSWVEC